MRAVSVCEVALSERARSASSLIDRQSVFAAVIEPIYQPVLSNWEGGFADQALFMATHCIVLLTSILL